MEIDASQPARTGRTASTVRATRTYVRSSQLLRTPSACSELMGWGLESGNNLGLGSRGNRVELGSDSVKLPQIVSLHPLLVMER